MKKTLITVLAVLGVLIGAVLVVPSLIDWNGYRDEIARRISAMTGRAVELGDVRLTLLPAPAFSVRDARLANLPGAAEPDMVRLKQLDVLVAFGPLLRGDVQVESVTLVEPTLVFEVLPDGRFNWAFAETRSGGGGEGGGPGLFNTVRFDQVTIERGTVIARDATGRSERLENVTASVVAGSLAGPFQGQGGFTLRGVPLRVEMLTSRFVDGAAAQVRLAVSLPDTDATMRFSGIVAAASSGGTRLQGELRTEGGDLAPVAGALRALTGNDIPAALTGQPFSLRMALDASRAGAAFSGVEIQLGPTRATGSASLRTADPPHLDAALALNRVDLDAWFKRAAPAESPPPAPESPPAPAGKAAFALPESFSAKLDLSADALTYNGGLVRQGRVEASLASGTLNIDRLSALLPGGADLAAGGRITAVAGQPSLDLSVEANADNLRALLEWLKLDISGVATDRLRKTSLSARVQGRPERVEVSGIDLRLDTSHLTGGIAYANHGRPAFGVRLDVDRLNLDAYRAPEPEAVPGAAPASPRPAGKSPGPGPLERALRDVDANVELTAGQLTVNGLTVQGARLDATAAGGAVTLREAKLADLGGIAARASGQAAGLFPPRGVHLTVEAEAASLTGLAKLVPWPADAPPPERFGAVRAQGRVSGDLDRMAVELTAALAGGTLEAGGTLAGVRTEPAAELKLRTTHPDAVQLVRLVAPDSTLRLGPLDLYGEVAATPASLRVSGLQGTAAGTSVTGGAVVDLSRPKPRVEADLQAGDLDLDALAPAPARPTAAAPANAPAAAPASAPTPMNLAWMRGLDGTLALTAASLTTEGVRVENPALRAALADGVLRLEQFDGGVLGGRLGATGRLSAPADRAPDAELNLTLVKAQLAKAFAGGTLDLAGGTLDLDHDLAGAGADRRAMLATLSGTGRIAARDGVVKGLDLGVLRDRLTRLDRPQDALEAVLRSLQGGETRFARLDGTFTVDRGIAVTEDLRMTSELGDAAGAGQVNLPAGTMDLRVRVEPRADQPLPPVTVRLTGPLDRPTRSFEMREVQEYMAKRAAGGLVEKLVPPDILPRGGSAQPQEVIRGLLDGLRK